MQQTPTMSTASNNPLRNKFALAFVVLGCLLVAALLASPYAAACHSEQHISVHHEMSTLVAHQPAEHNMLVSKSPAGDEKCLSLSGCEACQLNCHCVSSVALEEASKDQFVESLGWKSTRRQAMLAYVSLHQGSLLRPPIG